MKKEVDEIKLFIPKVIKCDKCDFISKSETALKAHENMKHIKLNKQKFPMNCNTCTQKDLQKSEIKMHMYSHFYRNSKFSCECCEYASENIFDMDFHFGKIHEEFPKCGVCDEDFENVEDLDKHKENCKIFECNNCWLRTCDKGELKEHMKDKHEGQNIKIIIATGYKDGYDVTEEWRDEFLSGIENYSNQN